MARTFAAAGRLPRRKRTTNFLIEEQAHKLEYVSPLHINGEIKGAIVVGFASKRDFTEAKSIMIDAATQMAAMSVNLSAHYEAAINNSINAGPGRTPPVHRSRTRCPARFALRRRPRLSDRHVEPPSRDRRTRAFRGTRRSGEMCSKCYRKYPEGRVREEFERAFRTGQIERIEQQTIGRGRFDASIGW